MPGLFPLLLRPEFHERVWGARSLAPYYAREVSNDPIGEVWLTGENCVVVNGPLAGRSLSHLSKELGGAGLQRFPLLIKFLFPKDKLSVQVHPDDEGAARLGQACGKTECWYILQAEPGAQIGLGLKPGVTRTEVRRAIDEVRLEPLLNWIDVHEGDMIYVDAGTIHAIGPGAVIVETQQNSDTTFRLYDYGRPRELHVEHGLQAVKEQTRAGKVARSAPHSEKGKDQVNLVASPHFVVDKCKLSQPWEFRRPRHAQPSVWCLVAIGGCGTVLAEGAEPVVFHCGESVVVPASTGQFKVQPQWDLEFLCASVPVEEVAPPETTLP
jgi:mannose-6-phosphate isomerase